MASEDDVSDLTDIESDDYAETKKKKKPTAANKPTYKIKNALKVPRATTYTAQALYGRFTSFCKVFIISWTIDQIHSCDINLEPEYQRGLDSSDVAF